MEMEKDGRVGVGMDGWMDGLISSVKGVLEKLKSKDNQIAFGCLRVRKRTQSKANRAQVVILSSFVIYLVWMVGT